MRKTPLEQIFRFARESQGIKQALIAQKAGIAQPSLSQFENGQATLSRETLLTIAPPLSINPEYITDEFANPFKSSGLIKMFFVETLLAGMDYSPLEHIAKMNPSVEVVFLVATSRSKTIDRMISKTIIGQFTQAALLRDQDGNIFLFRRKRKGAYLVGELDLQARLLETAKAENKDVTFQTRKIPRELFLKIEDWTVERGDVEEYFVQQRTRMLSLDEDRVVEEIRAGRLKIEDLLSLAKKKKS